MKLVGKVLLSGIAKTIQKTAKVEPKTAKTVVRFGAVSTEPASKGAAKVLSKAGLIPQPTADVTKIFQTGSNFERLSPEMREFIADDFSKVLEILKAKGRVQEYQKYVSNIKTIISNCTNEKVLRHILGKGYSTYVRESTTIHKELSRQWKGIDQVVSKLTLMKLYNSENYKKLINLKEYKEMLRGEFSPEYIPRPDVTIGEGYFEGLFKHLETRILQRAEKSGFNSENLRKYAQMNHKKIYGNGQFIYKFIKKLENIKDADMVNILLEMRAHSTFQQFPDEIFLNVIDLAAENPKNMKYLLRLKYKSFYSLRAMATKMKNQNDWKISDKMFNEFLEYEKDGVPNLFLLDEINCFLGIKGTNEKLVKDILTFIRKHPDDSEICNLFMMSSEHNLPLIKYCVNKGSITEEELFKIKMLRYQRNLTDREIAQYYGKYNSLKGSLGEDFKSDLFMSTISDNPEYFAKLEELKVVDLVKSKKISPNILYSFSKSELRPEIIEDIKMLQNNETIIKRFTSLKDVLKQTKSGDVISVKGKLYLNNNGQLEVWNMTEEKFNELFPHVDRFVIAHQSMGDCYMLSVLNSSYSNSKTRAVYYKMFEQVGDDIYVTIPAYEDYFGKVKFPKGKIDANPYRANASLHIQMVEEAYARTALRSSHFDGTDVESLDKLLLRINSGYSQDAVREFFPRVTANKNIVRVFEKDEKDKVEALLKEYAGNSNYLMQYQYLRGGIESGHSVAIYSYNPIEKAVYILDSSFSQQTTKISLDEFLKNYHNMVITKVT